MGHELRLRLKINAPIEKVWSAITDWESQGDWMLQTRVWIEGEQREGVGVRVVAFTGPLHRFYPHFQTLGLLDLMKVTKWSPPGESAHCQVLHYGKVLKGTGDFHLSPIRSSSGNPSTFFTWSEEIEAPLPLFLLVAPFLYVGVLISLRKFRRRVAQKAG